MTGPRRWSSTTDHVDLTAASASRPMRLGALPQALTVDLERAAVIVVDMQNDFCTPGGWLDAIGVDVAPSAAAVRPIARLLPAFRAAAVPVVWLNWGNRPDLANLPPNVVHVYDPAGSGGGIGERVGASDAVLVEGSWGAAIVDGLSVEPGDLRVAKFRMSGFFDTALDSILRSHRVDTVFFAGVNADQCVLATLTDAACLGYDAVLIEEASATTSPDYCLAATLYNVRQCFGFTTTPDELLAALA